MLSLGVRHSQSPPHPEHGAAAAADPACLPVRIWLTLLCEGATSVVGCVVRCVLLPVFRCRRPDPGTPGCGCSSQCGLHGMLQAPSSPPDPEGADGPWSEAETSVGAQSMCETSQEEGGATATRVRERECQWPWPLGLVTAQVC